MKRAPLLFVILLCAFSIQAQTPGIAVDWQPIIEMDGQLFPSYVLATATQPKLDQSNDPNYLGDVNGQLGISVINPTDDARIRLVIKADPIAEISMFEGTLAQRGQKYEVFPEINYRYDSLSNIRQPIPVNVTLALYINDVLVGQRTKPLRVRSINDCPVGWLHRSGNFVDTSWMYAAYVNEDHPWIDQLLRESLDNHTVNSFRGYQGSQGDVFHQVFAIWNLFQRRGFRYSSITTTSGNSSTLISQHVRFLEDSVKTSQANCIDGSV